MYNGTENSQSHVHGRPHASKAQPRPQLANPWSPRGTPWLLTQHSKLNLASREIREANSRLTLTLDATAAERSLGTSSLPAQEDRTPPIFNAMSVHQGHKSFCPDRCTTNTRGAGSRQERQDDKDAECA